MSLLIFSPGARTVPLRHQTGSPPTGCHGRRAAPWGGICLAAGGVTCTSALGLAAPSAQGDAPGLLMEVILSHLESVRPSGSQSDAELTHCLIPPLVLRSVFCQHANLTPLPRSAPSSVRGTPPGSLCPSRIILPPPPSLWPPALLTPLSVRDTSLAFPPLHHLLAGPPLPGLCLPWSLPPFLLVTLLAFHSSVLLFSSPLLSDLGIF